LTSPHLPASVRGRQAFKETFGPVAMEALGETYTLDEILAEGDTVAARFTGRGTHRGEFAGLPPTGKPVVTEAVVIYRVANGQIVDYRLTWDTLGVMQQLGATLAPGGTAG